MRWCWERQEGPVLIGHTMQIGLLEPRYHVQKMQQATKELKSAAREAQKLSRETMVEQ